MGFTRVGRLCINTFRNNAGGFKLKAYLFPEGTRLCELICDQFTKDWGIWCLSVHVLKFRAEIEYRFGKKCFLGNKLA